MSLDNLASVLDTSYPESAPDVLATLTQLSQVLPDSDGITWFTRLYIKVAERVASAVRDGIFEDASFIEHLDVEFVRLYFAALASFVHTPDGTPRAWYPVFTVHDATDIAPIQFALAGMNAHINRDLMIALVNTWRERGSAPAADSANKRDYDRVNALLTQVELQVRDWFLHGLTRELEQHVERIDRVVESFSLVEARQSAWNHACALWALRDSELLTHAFIDGIDGLVGFAGRGLLVRVL